eukprot:Pompholyxophrys_punicea_v1_NODE_410_length_2029_cov_5.220365.p1 type:complete len:130 gc:universal NODE_410_length_2029_cov_5.220365:440-51(-)
MNMEKKSTGVEKKERKRRKVAEKYYTYYGAGLAKLKKEEKKEKYHSYIHKVLKRCHPNLGISKMAMEIMDSFVNDVFERIANEAANLVKHSRRTTMTSREIQTATRLILSGKLATHAFLAGTKAVAKVK